MSQENDIEQSMTAGDVGGVLADQSDVLLDTDGGEHLRETHDEQWQERESRNALKHVAGLGEIQDVTEVEYRKVRLERVVLVGVWSSRETTQAAAEESLRELAALAETAGAVVCDGLLQHRIKPDAATYVGSGKARELAGIVAQDEADTIVVDDDLPPSPTTRIGRRHQSEGGRPHRRHPRHLRTACDVARRQGAGGAGTARIHAAATARLGRSLSRQAGGRAAGDAGIGSRGPGETKIEMDRRVIRSRIAKLRRQIAQMAPARDVKRGARRRFGLPTVAVVGYTNAGKSSLTNRLTGSAELVENALFATLDTAVRRAKAKDGRLYAYVDTVGFVRRLPTQLIEAFKSTLEEVADADLIVHVVDGSHPDPFSQIDAVNDVLSDIDGVETIPTIVAFNKADRMDEAARERIEALMPEAHIVSAFSGEGVDALREHVESMLPTPNVHVEALLPYTAGSLMSRVREYGKVINVEYRDDGMMLEAEVDDQLAAQIVEQAID